jgi:hypothetical protein
MNHVHSNRWPLEKSLKEMKAFWGISREDKAM